MGLQPDPRQPFHGSCSGSGLMTFGGCQRLFGDAESISGPALSHTALFPRVTQLRMEVGLGAATIQ